MARYNTFVWGDGTLYGAGAVTEGGLVTWILQFDWDNNGSYDGTNEAGRLTDCTIARGRQDYLSEQGGGFEHMRPGKAVLKLDNYDRRYDPRNTASALYPNVLPGRKMILQVIDNSTQTTYTVFTGIIDDITPFNEPGGGVVQLECVDYQAFLNDQVLTFTAADQYIDIYDAYYTLLYNAGYPGSVNIDSDTQPVIVFGVTDQNAGEVAGQLADASLGHFFVSADGTATFYSRDHSYGDATVIDQAQVLNDPIVGQPWEDVYNHVTAIAQRPIREQPSIIYFLPGPFQFAQSTDTTLEVDYNPAWDVQISTYEANTAQDGSGTDITSTTTATPTLGFNGGQVVFRNDSNAGYITKLEIRGRTWGTIEQKYIFQDTTSQAKYGLRRFILDSPFLQDPNYANSFAETIKDWAKDDHENLTIQIQQREDIQYNLELMQLINFTSSTLDIDDNYYIMGIDHEWNKDTGQDVTTTLYLSKIITDDTSITPAPVLTEQEQAPPGYNNPPGDPETMAPVYEEPEWENVVANVLDPAFFRLHQLWPYGNPLYTINDWGKGYYSNPVEMDYPGDVWVNSVGQTDRIYLRKGGIWFVSLNITHWPDVTYIGKIQLKLKLYNQSNSNVDNSYDYAHEFYPDTGTNLSIDEMKNTITWLFEAEEDWYLKVDINTGYGGDCEGELIGFRICPTP